MEPEYACAVISDHRGWILLQLRPADAAVAPALLTCFGGRRESAETAEACLARELAEELGWDPPGATPCCELWDGRRFIARFYDTGRTGSQILRATEPGHLAIAAPWSTLPGLPISPWHRLVLDAVAAGRDRVDLSEP